MFLGHFFLPSYQVGEGPADSTGMHKFAGLTLPQSCMPLNITHSLCLHALKLCMHFILHNFLAPTPLSARTYMQQAESWLNFSMPWMYLNEIYAMIRVYIVGGTSGGSIKKHITMGKQIACCSPGQGIVGREDNS